MPEPLYLSPQDFAASFKSAPRVAVCLVVRNEAGHILVSRRSANMEHMPGALHLPGSFVLRNEPIADALARSAHKEVGRSIRRYALLGAFEDLDGDPRGHVIDLAYEVELDGEPSVTEENERNEFLASIPDSIGFYHDRILEAAGLRRSI